jgi:SOS response regulatory protein OraA/RecX
MNQKIYHRALFLLGIRPYFRKELDQALKQKFPEQSNDEIDEILDQLTQLNMLNDEQLTRDFARYTLERKPIGLFLLRQKLMQKGAPHDAIDEVCETYIETEIDRAKALAQTKKQTLKAGEDTIKQKAKLQRFLQSRGFDFSVIHEAVDECFVDD